MKKYLGPLLLFFSFQAFARNPTTSLLFLRARVPASYQIQVHVDKNGIHPKIKTNAPKGFARPKFHVTKLAHSYIVSVVHP